VEQNAKRLRVYKNQWVMKDFKTKSIAKKKDFILQFVRIAFVNPDLVREGDITADAVTSLKPSTWKDNAPLDIKFASMDVVHMILNNLAGKKLLYPIRQWLPKILMARYDEIMKFRSNLKSASPERQLYVDVIPNPPFFVLVEKTEEEKRELEVTFNDARLADPSLITGPGPTRPVQPALLLPHNLVARRPVQGGAEWLPETRSRTHEKHD
jgi:hypothetical protein